MQRQTTNTTYTNKCLLTRHLQRSRRRTRYSDQRPDSAYTLNTRTSPIKTPTDLHTSPKRPLPRPSHITATNNPQEESDSPISDTETDSSYTLQTENTKFSSFQDHTAYITRPSAYSQSITILEDEVTSTPTRPRPIPLPRPSKATRAKQISTNQRKQPTPTHPNPTPDVKPQQKSPLLPTPPAPVRNFNCNNHYNQHIPGPSHPDTAHIQPSQDHHHSTTHIQPFQDQQTTDTTDLTSNITFQDHTQQDSITNDHHYFQDHQTNTRIS